MKRYALMAIVLTVFSSVAANAENRLFVGGWNGAGADNIYTSIKFNGGRQIEYCYLKQCSWWKARGNMKGTFRLSGPAGKWKFKWIDANSIDGTFTNAQGGVYKAIYHPN